MNDDNLATLSFFWNCFPQIKYTTYRTQTQKKTIDTEIELLSNEYLISGSFVKKKPITCFCVFNHRRNQIGSNSTIRIQMPQLIGLKSIQLRFHHDARPAIHCIR